MERSHTIADGEDVIVWSLIDQVTIEDVTRLFAEQVEFCAGKSDIYVIVDMRRMKKLDQEARHAAARGPMANGSVMPVRAIALVGGSFHLRLLGNMVNKAAALLNRVPENPMRFCDTMDEAKQWLAEQRQQRAKKS